MTYIIILISLFRSLFFFKFYSKILYTFVHSPRRKFSKFDIVIIENSYRQI